ncbi:MAG: O-antigen ligase family protein [Clostridia bacterium]|nr:O-antigen ligase family protein [Clostridia bacterium]MBQ9401447.1 O-antigen ligase family protein [Clostridia bacterium]
METGKKREIPKKLLLCLLFGGILVMCLEMGLSILRPGAPGSLARHAVFWAGCFGILAAGTLLVSFWQPAAKAWAWLNEKLMSPETRKPWIDIALAVVAGALLLHHFYVILYYPVIPAGASKLAPAMIALAAVTAVLGRSWRDRGTRLGALLLVFLFERTWLKSTGISGREVVYFSTGIYAVFVCYGLFAALRPAVWKSFLKTVCGLWSLCAFGLCMAGIVTAWTGNPVHNLAGEPVRVYLGRLELFANSDISGGWVVAGIAMAMTGFFLVRNAAARAGYLLTVFVSALTLSLTDSRSGFMMTAFLIAGMICVSIWNGVISKPEKLPKGKRALTVLALVLCFALCFVLIVKGEQELTGAFMKVRDQKGMLVSAAHAEEIPAADAAAELSPPDFVQRSVWTANENEIGRPLTGRVNYWLYALYYLRDHPVTLLTGLSVDGSASTVVWRPDHLHNLPLQILMEGGIPALLLFLGLLLVFFIHACRLWTRRGLLLWQRILPLPVLAILFQEMAECLTHFSFGHPPITVFYFLMGCTVAVSRKILSEEAGKTAGSISQSITGG